MLRPLSILAILAFITPAVLADTLVKYKEWDSSPQGYLMTKAEREHWAAIKTDAEAEQFINQFLAARGADFAADVAKRAEMADKYLTVGKTPGSKTLRGKVVIVLGPPSGFTVGTRNVRGERSATTDMITGASGDSGASGVAGGPSMRDMAAAAQREGMSGKEIREYTFTYAGDKAPLHRAQELTVTVGLDPVSGKEWFTDRKLEAELDELFEAMAASRLKK
jgi:GWxTD domain-containing protein